MINKLTKKQEAELVRYKDRWLDYGLATESVKKEKAINFAKELYSKLLGRKEPVATIVLPSPLSAWLGVYLLSSEKAQVWAQVRAQVRAQVSAQVRAQVRAQVSAQVESFIWPYLSGQFDSGYFSFYDYMNEILTVKIDPYLWYKFQLFMRTKDFGPIWPLEKFCIISDKPEVIKMKDSRLHCDGGPSVKYRDDFSIWSLNGVRVPKEIAETPASKLDASLVVKEQNAEVRREIIRKIGVERVYQKLGGKTLDRKDDYELVTLDLQDGRERPYLKMLNPSIGIWHLEGVPPEINTVEKALSWRNQTEDSPLVLT